MSSKSLFYIYDHWLMPTPYNHRFFVEKYAQGFVQHGFDVKLIKSLKEIKNQGIVMISSHHVLYGYDRGETNAVIKIVLGGLLRLSTRKVWGIRLFGWIEFISQYLKKYHLHNFLAYIRSKKNIVVTTWFTDKEVKIFEQYDTKVIYSGDYYYINPSNPCKDRYNFYKSRKDALPVKFSANVNPNMQNYINTWVKDIDVSFVGSRHYKREWYSYFKKLENTEIHPTPPYIPEEKRIDIYKRSKIVLGLHSEMNVKNGNVTERVFEALAYGAVCVTDNPSAKIATDNSVIVVNTKEECIKEIKKLMEDKNYYDLYRKKGIEFAYSKGLYYHRAKELLHLIKRLYNLTF